MEVIDYKQEYRYDSLNRFKSVDKLPQLAVSVDMLDTGIDVPEVCNLVFFKPVRSSAKFWQMIGRGTRLCVDLFGPGEHKREFVIFDFCENFEFFGTHPRGFDGSTGKTLSQRLFELRLRLSFVLLQSEEEDLFGYGRQLREYLIQQTQALNTQSFVVRQHWEQVEKYRDPHRWNALTELDLLELRDHIAPLMSETEQDEKAKRFDALMLDLQWSVLQEEQPRADLIEKVMTTAGKLSKKGAIPVVNAKMDLLQRIQNRNYWDNITVSAIEQLRLELRDLLKFLDKDSSPVYYTSFEDELKIGNVQEHRLLFNVNNLETYRRRVEQYLHEQSHHLTIRKLRNNEPITQAELQALEQMLFEQGSLGTRDEFSRVYGNQPLGRFIRSIMGLDSNAAKAAFASLLREQTFNAQQIRFLDTLINFLTVKGVVDAAMLFEAPFTDLNSSGIMGVFDEATSARIIDLLEEVNRNAEVA
jgi:type I restriction enzyme R subunit